MPQTQDFNIRYVKEEDYSYILEYCKQILEKVLPGKKFEEEKIDIIFEQALENDTHTGIVLVDSEGTPKGFILAAISELYFHSTKAAVCLSIWVDPASRGHSLDMLRALESWANYKKADVITISSFNNLSPSNFNKVLHRFEYLPKESVYWKEL